MKNLHKNKVILTITMIFCLLICLCTIPAIIIISIPGTTVLYDLSNTIEESATVTSVKVNENGRYEISVEEFNAVLYTDSDAIIDKKELMQLSQGERITFRIPKSFLFILNNPDVDKILIVSLKTDEKELVTLKSYNENVIEKRDLQSQKVASIAATVTSLGFILCLIKILHLNKIKKLSAKNDEKNRLMPNRRNIFIIISYVIFSI